MEIEKEKWSHKKNKIIFKCEQKILFILRIAPDHTDFTPKRTWPKNYKISIMYVLYLAETMKYLKKHHYQHSVQGPKHDTRKYFSNMNYMKLTII